MRALGIEISRRAAEVASARQGRRSDAPDPSGSAARDILAQLFVHGPQTLERLGIEAQIPTRALESYVRALERAGAVSVARVGSRRGTLRRIVAPRPEARLRPAS